MSVIQVEIYETTDKRYPFIEWLKGVKDEKASAAIKARLNRVRNGNLGDFKSVGEGVYELRVDVGPGYRAYCGLWDKNKLVMILCGGTKRTQKRDIAKAQIYWQDWKDRNT